MPCRLPPLLPPRKQTLADAEEATGQRSWRAASPSRATVAQTGVRPRRPQMPTSHDTSGSDTRAPRTPASAGWLASGGVDLLVHRDDARATQAEVVLQRHLDAVDLAALGLAAQLPHQLGGLR